MSFTDNLSPSYNTTLVPLDPNDVKILSNELFNIVNMSNIQVPSEEYNRFISLCVSLSAHDIDIAQLQDDFAFSLLIRAIENDHYYFARYLLRHYPAITSVRDSVGRTVIHHMAASHDLLIRYGRIVREARPDMNAKTDCGYTPLIIALAPRQFFKSEEISMIRYFSKLTCPLLYDNTSSTCLHHLLRNITCEESITMITICDKHVVGSVLDHETVFEVPLIQHRQQQYMITSPRSESSSPSSSSSSSTSSPSTTPLYGSESNSNPVKPFNDTNDDIKTSSSYIDELSCIPTYTDLSQHIIVAPFTISAESHKHDHNIDGYHHNNTTSYPSQPSPTSTPLSVPRTVQLPPLPPLFKLKKNQKRPIIPQMNRLSSSSSSTSSSSLSLPSSSLPSSLSSASLFGSSSFGPSSSSYSIPNDIYTDKVSLVHSLPIEIGALKRKKAGLPKQFAKKPALNPLKVPLNIPETSIYSSIVPRNVTNTPTLQNNDNAKKRKWSHDSQSQIDLSMVPLSPTLSYSSSLTIQNNNHNDNSNQLNNFMRMQSYIQDQYDMNKNNNNRYDSNSNINRNNGKINKKNNNNNSDILSIFSPLGNTTNVGPPVADSRIHYITEYDDIILEVLVLLLDTIRDHIRTYSDMNNNKGVFSHIQLNTINNDNNNNIDTNNKNSENKNNGITNTSIDHNNESNKTYKQALDHNRDPDHSNGDVTKQPEPNILKNEHGVSKKLNEDGVRTISNEYECPCCHS